MVRLYRTFSIYSIAGETRCAGCLCTSSGWFKHSEHHRTDTNHSITELARCVEVYHMRSGWFDRVLMHLFGVVQAQRTSSNLSNHNITKLARCGEVCPLSSGWFDCTEPSLATALQGKQRLLCEEVVRVGSRRFAVLEPPRTRVHAPHTCPVECR